MKQNSTAPSPLLSPTKRSVLIKIGFSILILAFAGELLWGYEYIKNKQSNKNQTPVSQGLLHPTPTPAPLAQGKQVYFIRSGNKTGPQITEIAVDPFDPKNGEAQQYEVKINDNRTIISVTLNLKTDHGNKIYSLLLSEGTSLSGKWTTSFSTEDSHDNTYQVILDVSDAQEKNKVELTFR